MLFSKTPRLGLDFTVILCPTYPFLTPVTDHPYYQQTPFPMSLSLILFVASYSW